MMLCLLLLSLTLVLSACGGDDKNAAKDNSNEAANKPKVGLNKITLGDLIEKKNNKEAFYVLLFDAPKKKVKETKFLKAYDKELKKQDITAFYLNLKDKNSKKLKSLEKEFEAQSSFSHSPFTDGGLAIVYKEKLDSPFDYYAKARFLNMLIETHAKKDITFFDDKLNSKIKNGIQLGKDYVKEFKIELTY